MQILLYMKSAFECSRRFTAHGIYTVKMQTSSSFFLKVKVFVSFSFHHYIAGGERRRRRHESGGERAKQKRNSLRERKKEGSNSND
jgi:hypothetical protein